VRGIACHGGFTANLEIYGRSSYLYTSSRAGSREQREHLTNHRFLDSWLGASYQFKKDKETPALIGFLETPLSEIRLKEQ